MIQKTEDFTAYNQCGSGQIWLKMYKSTTYLTNIFSKFHISDENVRKIIIQLYGKLIENILCGVSSGGKRVIILAHLSLAIKRTVNYLNDFDITIILDQSAYKALEALATVSNDLITKVGLRSKYPSVVDDILKQVFIEDIACDIGVCVREFKDAKNLHDRVGIVRRLQMLIIDFNSVRQTNLTVRSVLKNRASLSDAEEL